MSATDDPAVPAARPRVDLLVCLADRSGPDSAAVVESVDRWNADHLRVDVLTGPARQVAAIEHAVESGADACLLLDERCVILRPFGVRDFVDAYGTPYAFLTEDHEYWVDPPPTEAAALRDRGAHALAMLGSSGTLARGNRGPVLVSAAVLRRLQHEALDPRGLTWAAMLEAVPDVGIWYSAWLQIDSCAGVEVREPLFRTVLTPGERASLAIHGQTAADLARGYVGIVTPAGAWAALSRGAHGSGGDALTSTSRGTLLWALAWKPYLRAPRLQRLVSRVRRGA